nr:LOW QUALITY PROTEIN: titin-like [Aedes albopictus]
MQQDRATSIIIEQTIASQTQTITHDSLGNLKAPDAIDSKHAIPQISDIHVPSQLETVPSEALEQLKQQQDTLERSATVNISDFIVPLQSHTISADTTAPFEESTEPRKFATKSIQEGLRAAECMEVSSNELNDITEPTEAPHGQASVSFTTNTIANVMETTTHENVDNITVHREPTERFAQLTQSMFDIYEESMPLIREDHTPITAIQTRTYKQSLHDETTEHTTNQEQQMISQIHQPLQIHATHENQTEETFANITIQKKRKQTQQYVEIKENIEEMPEAINVTEIITAEGITKKQITKKRVIKKKMGKKEQITEIVTVQEDDELPQTTVTITESELPFEEVTEFKPSLVEPQEAIIQELPEEVKVTEVITEEGKPKKQVTKKRVIKKKAGKKEQVTEIVTVQEDDQLPQTTVTVTESELPFEEVIELKPSLLEPQEAIIQELPEEVKVTEVITEEGKPKKQVTKKRIIKKKAGKKEQVTEIVTVQEDDELPQTTVTVTESELPFEEVTEFKPSLVEPQEAIIQELPEEVKVTEVITEEGKPKKQVTKKRIIKKKAGKKEQVTEIVTIQEDDQLPQTTVTVTESELPFEEVTEFKPALVETQEAIIQELPEVVKVTEVITEEGKPKKQVTKKRIIKKKAGKKEQVTEIVTVQEDDELPQTTVTVTESELPFEEVTEFKPSLVEPQEAIIQELPEEVKVTEVITEEGKPKKQVTKKRIIKKKAGKKEQVTEIITVQEDDELPQTTVTVTESELPFGEVTEFEPSLVEPQEATIQELPEEVKVTEVITEEGKPKKQVTKKRIIKKKAGKKEQVTEIVTVQEDDELPRTTVTVTESELPFEEVTEFKPSLVEPQEAIIQELPEEVKVTEVITEEGKPKKQVTKKRVIKKKAGKKEQVTEIVTVQEDDQLPQTTVTVTESELPFEDVTEFKPLLVEHQEAIIQELPEEKKAGKKEQVTEIVTVQEDDELPQTTVTVTESELPFEEVTELNYHLWNLRKPSFKNFLKRFKVTERSPNQAIFSCEPQEAIIQELPEEVKVTEVITEEGKPKKQVTKSVSSRKKAGKKEQVTEIVTVQEDDQLPQTTVTVTESELPFERNFLKRSRSQVITKEGKPKKQVTKKRVIKKRPEKEEQVTEMSLSKKTIKLPQTLSPSLSPSCHSKRGQGHRGDTEEGKPKKQVTKKRVIKKKAEEKNRSPRSSLSKKTISCLKQLSPSESELPFEEVTEFKPSRVEPQEASFKNFLKRSSHRGSPSFKNFPEEVKVTEVITEEGKSKKQVTKTYHQEEGRKKEQVTEIVTVQEDDHLPQNNCHRH